MAVSQYDKEHLTSDQQAQIQAVTDAAQAGSMDWSTAHSIAENIRGQAAGGGYSGGQHGDEYNPVPGNGNKANAYDGTNYHADAINAARNYAKQASSGGAGDWGAVLDALAMRDQKVAAIGTDYGRSSTDILQELYDQYYAPYPITYGGSEWDGALDQAAQQFLGMSYKDWTQGEEYKALADRFGIQGQKAMQDVLGQISSRTGGLASSYATTAAQQQYNEYMSQLEEVARQMYENDRGDLLENAQLSQGLADRDYDRFLDSLDQFFANRDYLYQVGRDQIADSRYDQEYSDRRSDLEYERNQITKAEVQERINAHLAAYGSVADLDPALVETSGYTASEMAALEQYYANQQAQEAAAAAKKNTGSSGGGGDDTPQESDRYSDIRKNAMGYDDPEDAEAYLNRMVDGGYITADEAYNIFMVDLGGDVGGVDTVVSVPTTFEEFSAKTGYPGIMTESEFRRAGGTGRTKGYANYQDYLAAMWEKYKPN